MPKVTIICPTFDHQDTLYPVMESIRRQTFQDFEVVVIGDGAPSRTTKIMTDICDNDLRFHYRLFPKSERTGEPYRDIIIRESQSDIIAYICDDDLWLPWHLDWMVTALQTADFAHSMNYDIHLDGHIESVLFQFNSQLLRERVVNGEILWMFGLSFAAHTRKAYLDLPQGWDTAPIGMATDKNMWIKFARASKIKFWECCYPTALHFADSPRSQNNPVKRAEELWKYLDSFSNTEYVLSLLERVSFFHYVSSNLCQQAPRQLLTIQHVFEFYDIQIQELFEPMLVTQLPNSNVFYFRSQSIRLLDIYWKYLNGSIDDQTTMQRIEEYLEEMPWNNDARLILFRLYMRNKSFEQAENLVNYFDINRVSERYIIPLGRVLIKQGKTTDAQRIIDVLQKRKMDVSKLIALMDASQMDNIS